MGLDEAVKKKFQGEVPDYSRASRLRNAGRQQHDPRDLMKKVKVELPMVKSNYLVREDQLLIYWERQVRLYLKAHVSPRHPYRITASLVWEWVNGPFEAVQGGAGVANPDLRRINKILRHYFGASYKTYLMGKASANTYRVKRGFYLRYHQPMTLTLYAEFLEGTLYP